MVITVGNAGLLSKSKREIQDDKIRKKARAAGFYYLYTITTVRGKPFTWNDLPDGKSGDEIGPLVFFGRDTALAWGSRIVGNGGTFRLIRMNIAPAGWGLQHYEGSVDDSELVRVGPNAEIFAREGF